MDLEVKIPVNGRNKIPGEKQKRYKLPLMFLDAKLPMES